MKKFKENIFQKICSRNTLIAILFVVFLFLRLFVNQASSSLILASDNLKYLEASENFPFHSLYNGQLYLLHPPMFPYAIHFSSMVFQDDRIAAMIVSLLSSIITFFIIYKFFMLLTGNFNKAYAVLVLFTLSVPFIIASTAVLKESMVLILVFLTLYFYVKGVKFYEKKSIILSAIFGSMMAITVDHVIFLFPSFIISYLIFNRQKVYIKKLKFPYLKYALVPFLLTLLFYGAWTSIKYYQYSHYKYYPNGLEGAPVNTDGLNIFSVISPSYFKDFSPPYIAPGAVSVIKKYIFQFGYMFNMQPFSIPLGLNLTTFKYLLMPVHIVYMILLYIPLAIITAYGFFQIIKKALKKERIHNNYDLYIIGVFLIFLFPITQKMTTPRFIYTSYIIFFYFIAYGIILALEKLKVVLTYKKMLVFVILLLEILPFWYYHHQTLVFSTEKFISAQNTANYINANIGKENVIMAQQGYSAKLAYLTDNKVIGIYSIPGKLQDTIDYFNVSYIVFGRHYTSDVFHYNVETINYIKNNPNKFKFVAKVYEDYSRFYSEKDLARNDEVYIYKVVGDANQR